MFDMRINVQYPASCRLYPISSSTEYPFAGAWLMALALLSPCSFSFLVSERIDDSYNMTTMSGHGYRSSHSDSPCESLPQQQQQKSGMRLILDSGRWVVGCNCFGWTKKGYPCALILPNSVKRTCVCSILRIGDGNQQMIWYALNDKTRKGLQWILFVESIHTGLRCCWAVFFNRQAPQQTGFTAQGWFLLSSIAKIRYIYVQPQNHTLFIAFHL